VPPRRNRGTHSCARGSRNSTSRDELCNAVHRFSSLDTLASAGGARNCALSARLTAMQTSCPAAATSTARGILSTENSNCACNSMRISSFSAKKQWECAESLPVSSRLTGRYTLRRRETRRVNWHSKHESLREWGKVCEYAKFQSSLTKGKWLNSTIFNRIRACTHPPCCRCVAANQNAAELLATQNGE